MIDVNEELDLVFNYDKPKEYFMEGVMKGIWRIVEGGNEENMKGSIIWETNRQTDI